MGTQIFFREVREKGAWNATVVGLGGSALQSWEWGEFRRRGGWEPLRLLEEEGKAACQVLFRRLPAFGRLAYIPHGPLFADGADSAYTLEAISGYAKRRGAFLLRVEPRLAEAQTLTADGFVASQNSFQPRCTLVVRVLENPDEQMKALPKDARYGVRRAQREGVEASVSTDTDDLEEFLDLLEGTANRHHFVPRPREYYRYAMQDLPTCLILARHEGRLISGAMILAFGEEAYYLYGASQEGEKLYASYLVQHEALSAARQRRVRRYDMWGIPCQPHKGHPLWGVYQFKKKFGGEEKRYVGAYEKALSPLRARLFRAGIRGYYALQEFRGTPRGALAD